MSTTRILLSSLLAGTLVLSLIPAPTGPAGPLEEPGGLPFPARSDWGFVENLGQWPHNCPYVGRLGAAAVFLEARGWTAVPFPGAGPALRFRFEGGGGRPLLEPEERLPGVFNFFLGADPGRWRSGAARYASVRFLGLYRGVDLRVRGNAGSLEYDLLIEPGADLEQVEVRVEGAEGLLCDGGGGLEIRTASGTVRQRPPVAWESLPGGGSRPVACRCVPRGPDRFGFEAAGWSRELALVVDPVLVFATFAGTAAADQAYTVVTSSGRILVGGTTASPAYPTTPGAYSTVHKGGNDAFVSCFDPAGRALVFSTFLGGGGAETCRSLALMGGGMINVAGATQSADFPVTPGAYQTVHQGNYDIYVARLDPAGAALIYSTYIGGTGSDSALALRVDAAGYAVVCGQSQSTDAPTTPGAYDTTHNGGQDVYVAKLDPIGRNLVFGTYIGGTGSDYGAAMDLGPQGQAVITGYASHASYPVTANVFQGAHAGAFDAFVASLDSSGASLLFSTFLGGKGNDIGYALAVDGAGVVTVAGETDGSTGNFPVTAGAFDTSFNSPSTATRDAFVARLDAAGSQLIYSTFLGGSAMDQARGLFLEPDGSAVVTGNTASTDFPVTPDAIQTACAGARDAFVSRLDPTGSILAWSSYLGGTGEDYGDAAAMARLGQALVASNTTSADFPVTAGAFNTVHGGAQDAFLACVPLHADGVARFGSASANCMGAPAAYAAADARAGAAGFGWVCWKAPPASAGLLLLGLKALPAPVPALGMRLWVSPSPVLLALPATSDAGGLCALPLAIPPGTQGARLFSQFIWLNTPACPGSGPLSASDALEILVQ